VNEQAFHVGLLVAAVAVAGWAFGLHQGASQATAGAVSGHRLTPLSLIPRGSAFVLTADLPELVRAPVGKLLALRLGHFGDAGDLTTLCGFDPLTRLDQLALAVPSATLGAQDHPEDFGIVASGRFSAAEIMRCASGAITAHQGEAVQSKLGSFSSVRDHKHSGGEVAAKDGLLLVSGGNYFRELLDAAEGNTPQAPPDARDARHTELRRALGAAPLVASWVLGEGWFTRVAGEEQDARLSPLAT
jgi:hypothetical protein